MVDCEAPALRLGAANPAATREQQQQESNG
jgi:hypothetical protein